ncbi:MAG TPA: hypothetical protein VMR41_01995 [Patescibacteria group bacterium]|nr:hypothetical protein [Patescibacteria group bacterium]
MNILLPGILEKEQSNISQKITAVSSFSKEIHIDLIDGKFAQNSTFADPEFFKQFTKDIFFELHMMVDNPVQYLKPWADAGFKRFIGHIEKMPDIDEFIAQTQLVGEVGLAIDAKTPLDNLKINFDDIDNILIMTVNAGQSGQQFMPECLEKVKKLREQTLIPLTVDGGINEETLVNSAKAGANRFITTSALFESKDPKKTYENLIKLAEANLQLPPVTSL